LRSSDPRVPLEAVITTAELSHRPSRLADYESESRAVVELMDQMTNAAGTAAADRVLQRLVETALTLCAAHSAGVSILEREGTHEILRWRAVTGAWRKFLGRSIRREESPCGTVLDQDIPLLMAHPDRHFLYSADALPIFELLLVPFHFHGRPVGTVWVIAHDETRQFDAEDQRLVTTLSHCAASAYQLLVALELRAKLAAQRGVEDQLAGDVQRLRKFETSLRGAPADLETESD